MEAGCRIEPGLSVNIKRSDGRIHSALVSHVSWETRSVTVEWFEKGETKGKEVEISLVIALNPELIETSKSLRQTQQSAQSQQNLQTQNNQMQPPRVLRSSSRASIPVSNKGSYRLPTNNNRRQTNVTQPENVNGKTEREGGRENIPPMPTQQNARTNEQPNRNIQSQMANLPVSSATVTQNKQSRKSTVVEEVERLKKNREERRQRQAEEKAEKEALMNLDPGNPNWEFLAMIREYQNSIDFRPLRGNEGVEDHQITVCVRKRPLNKKENNFKEVDVISIPSKDSIVIHEPKNKVDLTKFLENQLFRFDYVFNDKCDNELVYKYTAKPLVKTVFEGGMATCFAYGQTGSGKTHTMGGVFQGKTQNCKNGIYAMVAKDVFEYLNSPKYKSLKLMVSASFFEIYSGKVFDLLADKSKLRVLEDGKGQVQIVGLTEKVVDNCDEVLRLIQHGNQARTSGQTSANSNSSRSHAVFQIVLRPCGLNRIHGKFSLIDLAGNERGADTSSANRQTRMEGAEINKSLLALKECIRALGRKGTHLPFRASKLTQVLRDSFIGDKSRTCMIAMISPGMKSCEHTLNTLRYADRVKELAVVDPSEPRGGDNDDPPEEILNHSATHHHDDSDLERLRSLNEGDMSADMYNFHEAVSQLQMAEEEVLENHKNILEQLQEFSNESLRLFNMTKVVDYDQDMYSQRWESLLQQQVNRLMQARNLVCEFRSKLKEEEEVSKKMKIKKNFDN
ncbi:kinesin-like protein Klp10A [Chrysoperla carnea]|uniref:kinesin-like protein Klp10A n=1 Tax=Chrysoperla carnea TaxID=189513 RepID=UPI001D086982|nr:kinesin-like protein Klp10A [Chrysoperla carnea]